MLLDMERREDCSAETSDAHKEATSPRKPGAEPRGLSALLLECATAASAKVL